jgi:hypothetical protein
MDREIKRNIHLVMMRRNIEDLEKLENQWLWREKSKLLGQFVIVGVH